MPQPTRQDFEHLLAFRSSLRQFERWSDAQARAAGLTHVQHQLLVAVKGHPGSDPPSVRELAGYLLLRHHSTVELVDRAEAAGIVRRVPDASDGRLVRDPADAARRAHPDRADPGPPGRAACPRRGSGRAGRRGQKLTQAASAAEASHPLGKVPGYRTVIAPGWLRAFGDRR